MTGLEATTLAGSDITKGRGEKSARTGVGVRAAAVAAGVKAVGAGSHTGRRLSGSGRATRTQQLLSYRVTISLMFSSVPFLYCRSNEGSSALTT